jgi:DNA-binding transcriptional regulator GbsR (MarR family)
MREKRIFFSNFEPESAHMELSPAQQKFIQTWGDMSSSWGISRTMSQIYALLFSTEEALDTDTIMERLHISRGNANMNLRELMEWGLVKKQSRPPGRKDYYSAEKDVWLLTSLILVERQKRELKPVTDALNEMIRELHADQEGNPKEMSEEEKAFAEHMQQLCDFLILFNDFTAKVLPYLKEKNIRRLDKLLQVLNAI